MPTRVYTDKQLEEIKRHLRPKSMPKCRQSLLVGYPCSWNEKIEDLANQYLKERRTRLPVKKIGSTRKSYHLRKSNFRN